MFSLKTLKPNLHLIPNIKPIEVMNMCAHSVVVIFLNFQLLKSIWEKKINKNHLCAMLMTATKDSHLLEIWIDIWRFIKIFRSTFVLTSNVWRNLSTSPLWRYTWGYIPTITNMYAIREDVIRSSLIKQVLTTISRKLIFSFA